jgi:hypothetical protein
VLFVDYVTNLESVYLNARVITCLHHPKSGLGEPSVLPIVDCEVFPAYSKSTSIALVSTKQPVPRCPAQPNLAILLELQLAKTEFNSNDVKLKSCAWNKIPLFDAKGRLLSGRWKTKLKALPIKSDTSLEAMKNLTDVSLLIK